MTTAILNPKESRYCDSVTAEHADYDWSSGYGEAWESYEAVRCACGHILPPSESVCPVPQAEDYDEAKDEYAGQHCDDDRASEDRQGPMMSGYWPLPGFRGDADTTAEAIVDLPLCLVHIEESDAWGLALTGGGMDLSWEIAEAYALVGFMPPAAIELPAMCGRGTSKRDRAIIATMRESYQTGADWFLGRAARLKQLTKRK